MFVQFNSKPIGNTNPKTRYDGVFQHMLDSCVIKRVPLGEIACSHPKF